METAIENGISILSVQTEDFCFSHRLIAFDAIDDDNFLLIELESDAITLQYIFKLSACELLFIQNEQVLKKNKNISHFKFSIPISSNQFIVYSALKNILGNHIKISRSIDAQSQMILFQIAQIQFRKDWLQIWLLSKLAELITCIYQSAEQDLNEAQVSNWLKDVDKEKIYKAKELLLGQIHKAIPIKTLAKRVGLNENYLKKGFKEIYGTTIYQFFQDERMKQATLLLKSEEKTVKEVAYLLGYNSISHFSTAFKKTQGINPCELIR